MTSFRHNIDRFSIHLEIDTISDIPSFKTKLKISTKYQHELDGLLVPPFKTCSHSSTSVPHYCGEDVRYCHTCERLIGT